MNHLINKTHDPDLQSWVDSANQANTDFPIQNLPLGSFRHAATKEKIRLGVAIGDQILDLNRCRELSLFKGLPAELIDATSTTSLNALMALGNRPMSLLRQRLSDILNAGQSRAELSTLVPISESELHLPVEVGDFSDFYASIFHAQNVGKLFRPNNPLLPNFKHVPIAYHGRTSSIIISGTPIQRPCGQTKPSDANLPTFGPSKHFDYEIEVGYFVGTGNTLGQPVPIDKAEEQIFGLSLLNDWSARDLQIWEYQPLGPFLSKSFATSVSPWVITMEALAPFRCKAYMRPKSDPQPLPYLSSELNKTEGGIDLKVEVLLSSAEMRNQGLEPSRISFGSTKETYWTIAQLVAHHTSNGCNLCPGDLLASGTVSGSQEGSQGCLLEMTQRGAYPFKLPTGEQRSFLLDGDEVIFRGYCERQGYKSIGLGECKGLVLPVSH